MLKGTSVIRAVVLTLGFFSFSALAVSPKDALLATLNSSSEIAAARSVVEQQLSQLRITQSAYRPSVSVSLRAGATRLEGDALSLALSDKDFLSMHQVDLRVVQPLLVDDPKAAMSAEEARLAAARYNVLSEAENVAADLMLSYYEILKQHHLVALARENLSRLQAVQIQVEQGVVSGVFQGADLEHTNSRTYFAHSTLESRQIALKDAQDTVIQLMGYRPSSVIEMKGWQIIAQEILQSFAQDSAQKLKEVVEASPSVQSARYAVSFEKSQVKQQRRAYLPQVSLELSHSNRKNASGISGSVRDTQILGVVDWDIWQGGSKKEHALKLSLEREHGETENLRTAMERIRSEVLVALRALDGGFKRFQMMEMQAKSQEMVRRAYEQQFKVGRRTVLNVLDSENELFISLSNKVIAQYQVIQNIVRYRAAVGMLVDSILRS